MITVIRDAWLVTQNAAREVLRGDLAIDGETIVQVGGEYNGTGDVEIAAAGDIVIPGLINTHTHVAMSVMKGVVDDLPFDEFLDRVFRIDSDRTDEDLAVGTMIGCMEMMLGGTTTFVDMYYSEDVIAEAVARTGLRGVLCWCVLDQQFTTQEGDPLDNCRRFHAAYRDRRKIVPGVGLQGVYVCGEETCVGAAEFARSVDAPLTLHLSETRGEVNEHRRKTGKRPAEWLADLGVLGPGTIAAHSAWVTMNEVRLMGEAGMSVASCPVSNMKLATGGVAPVPEYIGAGVNVTVGTDGSTTNNSLDMLSEIKTLGLLQKASRWDPTVTTAQQLLDFATVNGAAAIGMGDRLGSLEVGKHADLAILDGGAPNLRPALPENIVANIVYSSSPANIRTVICQGDTVVEDGVIAGDWTEGLLEASEGIWRDLCLR
jgi:5-methylthioadenosine/S-adenosylhomocysteine deaminase